MKRINGLFDKLITYENLYTAFKKAYRGCSKSREAMGFNVRLETELIKLRNELTRRNYKPGGYRQFRIYDPKERDIAVAPFRDRVIHHAIVNVLEPVYERIFIHDSYATRKNKGTHKAVLRVQEFLKKNEWYLKTDINKYFDSVNHEILIRIIEKKIKDRDMIWLIERIIKAVPSERGIPIGNLTSQFLANVYLDPLDHFLKDHLRLKYYVRYMDDIVILSNDKEYLKYILGEMRDFVETKLKLVQKDRAVYMNRRSNGIGFCGARIFPNYLRIKRHSLKRGIDKFKKRQSAFKSGELNEINYTASVASII